MLIPDRRRRVLDHVRRQGSATVDQLTESLGVSRWTVRRDLDELESQGHVRRTHGGAVATPPTSRVDGETTAATGATEVEQNKLGIARAAAERIGDDSTILLLGGSTTQLLVPHLLRRRLTVITNGLDIAHGLRGAPDISLMVLGGLLHRQQMTLLGPLTDRAMADMHVEWIVAGAYGVDIEAGVTGAKIALAGQHRSMLQHADSLMVLADSTKLGRRGPTLLAPLDAVDVFITDSDADPSSVKALRLAGPDVVVT